MVIWNYTCDARTYEYQTTKYVVYTYVHKVHKIYMSLSELVESICIFIFVHFADAAAVAVSVLVGVCLFNVTSIQATTG